MPITAAQRIIGAVERNGITWGDVIALVSHDENLPFDDAAVLVDRLQEDGKCPVVVAAAVISIIADLRVAKRGH